MQIDEERSQELYEIICDSLLKDDFTVYRLFHHYIEHLCEAQKIICAKEYMKAELNVASKIKDAHLPYDLMKKPEH